MEKHESLALCQIVEERESLKDKHRGANDEGKCFIMADENMNNVVVHNVVDTFGVSMVDLKQ